MRVEHIIIRKIDEMPETLQHAAHEHYLESGFDMAWGDEWRDSLKDFCEVFPVTVRNWEIGNGTSITWGLSSTDDTDYAAQLSGLRLRTWLLNRYSHVLYKGKRYHKDKPDGRGYTQRYGTAMIEESCCPFTGFCGDEDILQPLRMFIAQPDKSASLEDIMRDCLYSWLHGFEQEWESQQTFEYFVDMAQANEWEFDESGRMA